MLYDSPIKEVYSLLFYKKKARFHFLYRNEFCVKIYVEILFINSCLLSDDDGNEIDDEAAIKQANTIPIHLKVKLSQILMHLL